MADETDWDRVGGIFDRLLAGGDPDATIASESDLLVRATAIRLWRDHLRAERENYLGAPMKFEILPIFSTGQRLLNRFHIQKMIGSGGMGEVYLAWDERLESRVAIKTIAPLLAPSPSIRRRFTAEVQNARRVTHPNICRIHEIFEDGETVFFSMEYLDGAPLSDVIASHARQPHARHMIRQMADALHAAHCTGVVHGDFKPANVMVVDSPALGAPRAVVMDFGLARALAAAPSDEPNLSVRAGTVDYMAPELRTGGAPNVRSDIFAFGKVAQELMPGHRFWDQCAAARPEARPENLEKVIRWLDPPTSRRYWIGGLAIAAAGVVLEGIRVARQTLIVIPAGARILVNGFRSAQERSLATLARSVLVTGLQQSPQLEPIAETPAQPLAGTTLTDLAKRLHAAFWIDGDLARSGASYSLDVRLYSFSAREVLATSVFRGAAVVALAQSAAEWVRKTAGESGRSLEANPPDVSRYTSDVPEALRQYYLAVECYARHGGNADVQQAEAFLREAIRLDPDFAQAHCLLGQAINASRKYDEAFREFELALRLATRREIPEQERIAIAAVYYKATEDPVKMVETSKLNVAHHPGNPHAYGALGESQVNSGDAAAGVESLRKAVSLAPDDWTLGLTLVNSLVEAGWFQQALDEYQAALSRGLANPWMHNGAGAAYLGLERYPESAAAFGQEPSDLERTVDLQMPAILQGHLDPAIAAMREQLASASSPVVSHRAHEFLCALYFATDKLDLAREHVRAMADLPPYPPMARKLAGSISWARRLGDNESLAIASELAGQMARQWPGNGMIDAIHRHAQAAQFWRRNRFADAEEMLLQSAGAAFSVWTLFDLAEFYTQRARWDLAEMYWDRFEARRGTLIVKSWCPVIWILVWLYRAAAAQSRNNRAMAFRYSQKVLDHWAQSNPRLPIVLNAGNINRASRTP